MSNISGLAERKQKKKCYCFFPKSPVIYYGVGTSAFITFFAWKALKHTMSRNSKSPLCSLLMFPKGWGR